jgi:LysM repeat protein
MTPKLNAIDQSWGFCPPATVEANHIELVMMYLSYDSSKNITVGKVKSYWAAGAASGLNWESDAGAPLQGAARGRSDAAAAVRQATALIRALGYTVPQLTAIYRNNGWLRPDQCISIIFSCDTDATPSRTLAYYQAATAVCRAAGFDCGAYGSYRVVKYLLSKKAITVAWQTYAWSGGQFLTSCHLYQYSNSHTLGGASVDYDFIQQRVGLGALWPVHSSTGVKPIPKPAPRPAPKPTPRGTISYTVHRGDTLSKIAGLHHVSVPALAKLNGIKNVHLIRVGQKLRIPGKPAGPRHVKPRHPTYTVRRGDTLSRIAQQHHVKGGYKTLARLNHLKNANVIRVGQTIRLG